MKRPGVRERIEELKAESSARCSLSREAYIRSLVEMYEAKPCDASMDNPRCDVLITRGQKHAVFPQKLAVGAQLSKLVGWDRPTEVRVEAGTRAGRLPWRALRGRWNAGRQQSKRRGGWQQCGAQSRKQAVPQARQALTRRQALEAFRDPVWRLERLYSIRTRDGSVIKFAPRPQQAQIIDLIYRQGCRRIIILKARQLGFSTLLGVICADRLCFGMGQQISADRPDHRGRPAEAARYRRWWLTTVLDPALKRELPITRSQHGGAGGEIRPPRGGEVERDVRRDARPRRGEQFFLGQRMGSHPASELDQQRGDSHGRAAIGRRRGVRRGDDMERRAQRASVESGQVRAGDAGGSEGTARLAGRVLPVAGRPNLLTSGAAAAKRGDER